MTPPSAAPPPEDLVEREDLEGFEDEVPHDDAIIGRAFRASLVVAGLLALVVGAVVWTLREPEPAPPPEPPPYVPPRVAERAALPPPLPFVDVTERAGVDFVRENGAYGEKLLPETMGGGAAFFDAEGDGDPDLLLVNGAPWPGRADDGAPPPVSRLYANDGAGGFADATPGSGLEATLYGMGAACADVDGDARSDVLLTAVGPNRFFRNEGELRFAEATDEAALAGGEDDWSTSAAFFDADLDGDLDLFVCNYVRWSREIDLAVDYRLLGRDRAYGPPMNFEGAHSRFHENRGDGTFEDRSEEAGIRVENPATGAPEGKALGVAPADLDRDGWTDLVVANDTVRNFVFRNRGDATFEEVGALAGLAYDGDGRATGAMGIDVADYRGDGGLGIAIGNFANEMTSLYVWQERGYQFADEAVVEGIGPASRQRLSFGVAFLDVDLDGRLDLLQANGHLEDEINKVQPSQHFEQPAQLFWNAGEAGRATFVEVPPGTTGDLARPVVGRATAYADVDSDGDLDVVLTQSRGAPLLLRNDQALGNRWLRVRLAAPEGNRHGLGAEVEVEVDGVVQRRVVQPFRGYLSQVELPLTFGLGAAPRVDRVTVRWPGGGETTLRDVPAGTELVVERE